MDFDKILGHIGGFRWYQLYQYILVGIGAVPLGMQTLANVFVAAVPEHWCNIQELNRFNLTKDEQKRITTPHGMSQQTSCQIRDLDYSKININSLLNYTENSTTSHMVDCQQWQYDYSEYSYTTVARWDLVCNASWKRAMASSIYMAGFLIGCLCFGMFSDRYGRKNTWFAGLLLLIISGVTAAFLPEYWIHVFCRLLSGVAVGGCMTVGFVIVMEIIGIHERMLPGLWYQGFYAAGYMLLGPIAYAITDYRYLLLTIALLPCLFLPYYWLLEESPRWLITKGETKHAKRIIGKIAKINGKTVPEEMLVTDASAINSTEVHSNRRYTSLDLLRTRNMRKKSINVFFNWFVNSFVFYGLSFGVSGLAGSRHLNLFLSGAMEFPAYIIAGITLNRVGRRWPLALFMICGGISCCAMPAIPERITWLRITLAMLGKLGISGSFAIIYVFSAELFPTVVRTIGVGTGSMHARIGGLIAPFVAELGILVGWPPLPMLIFGSSAILAGLLALLLPETMNQKLPETLEDGEKFGTKCKVEVDIEHVGRLPEKEDMSMLHTPETDYILEKDVPST